jgi:UDP-glucose 4-epimerase
MHSDTVVVTGGAGFIGSHLVDALLAEGRRVVVVDDLSSGRAARVPSAADLEVVDLTDTPALDRVIDAARPRAIYHLGAQASVTASVADPARDLAVNVGGTLHVAEAARRHDAPVVFASTGGALYGPDAPRPTGEDFPPVPLSPYGASKLAGEGYLRTWASAYGQPHAVLRLGNVYGPRQSPHGEAGVVAIFSHRLLAGESLTLFGDGAPTRDYVHVDDVVRAFVAATGRPGTYNVGTGVETATHQLLRHLQEAAGTSASPQLAPLRAGELQRSCLDPGRARRDLGWEPEVDVADGLASTFRWFAEEAAEATTSAA